MRPGGRPARGPPARTALNGERLLPGTLLLVSAAATLGSRAVAVVLGGDGDDGAVGTATVLAAGGTVVVQGPEDALHPSMPLAALAAAGASGGAPSRVVLTTAGGLGATLTALVTGDHRAPTLARAS